MINYQVIIEYLWTNYVGWQKQKNGLSIQEIIEKSKISFTEIKNLYFYPSRRWDLELRNNIIIKNPGSTGK